MNRAKWTLIALSSAMFSLSACVETDTDGLNEEDSDVGQSERAGIGVAEQALVGATVTVDARRSLAVTEQAIMSGFSLQSVLDQLAAQSGVAGLTGTQLFQQLWDTQNPKPGLTNGPHCDDNPTLNGYAYGCRPAEGAQAQNPAAEIAKYQAIGLFNRFDLAPFSGVDCGEYRIVFARTPEAGKRNFLIFEAVLANPYPELGSIEGCRPVANFWANLSSVSDTTARKDALAKFYFNGLPGFMPVVHVENLGILGSGRSTTGQVRTNQFMQSPWMLREFKLQKTCGTSCQMVFQPVTDKTNPFGKLFSGNLYEPLAPEFQNTFFPSQVSSLAVNDLNGFSYSVPDKYNTGESNAQGSTDSYTQQFMGNGAFASKIQTQLTQIGSSLTPTNIVDRAQALSCAGCHQLSNGRALGGGLVWPASLGFTHVSEQQTEAGPDGTRFAISPALTNVFLPRRKAVLESFVNSPPIHSGVAQGQCLDNTGLNVQSWQCNGTTAQRWMFTAAGELRSALLTNHCLELENGGVSSGTNIKTGPCNGSNAQKWTRTAAGELRSVLAPSMCVDVSAASPNNGANVQLWSCNGTKAQRWFERPSLAVENPNDVPITIRGVRINGMVGASANKLVGVAPGQTMTVAVDYTISQMASCPSCIDQILIGFASGAQGCVYNGIPNATGTSGTGTITLTAPTTPGVYYVRFRNGQSFSCDLNWWTVDFTPTDKDNIAVITVN